MKYVFLFFLTPIVCFSQIDIDYNPSPENPFGKLNPDAPKEVADFGPLIGTCDCLSTTRNADQTWGKTQKMIWTFKYIMNGMAVQDETFKEDGIASGSIRQVISDSSKWYVHFYTTGKPSTVLPAWEGGKRGDSIVLYRDQKAPNGMEGMYRIVFSDMSDDGFNWIGEWVNSAETFSFPTWKIECTKRKPQSDLDIILENTKAFSKAYMIKDYEGLANLYAKDGKIFPSNSNIISGRAAIKKRWMLPEGMEVLHHRVTPSEVKIIGDHAYVYGYYEGKTKSKTNGVSDFKGKYVIVWKKTAGAWKIYLDIWNSL